MPSKIPVTFILNTSQTTRSTVLYSFPDARDLNTKDLHKDLLKTAKNKLKLRAAPKRLVNFQTGKELLVGDAESFSPAVSNAAHSEGSTLVSLLVVFNEPAVLPQFASPATNSGLGSSGLVPYPWSTISNHAPIESDAIKQLQVISRLEGMKRVVGMPDLHPGNRWPIGMVAMTEESKIYPPLIGGDVGCGMALYRLSISSASTKPSKLASLLHSLEGRYFDSTSSKGKSHEGYERYLEWHGISKNDQAWLKKKFDGDWESGLGTPGRGNHFAEILQWRKVEDREIFDNLGLNETNLILLVHSGSRGLGQSILHSFTNVGGELHLDVPEESPETPLEGSQEADSSSYLRAHDLALSWAKANRNLIARRVMEAIGQIDHGIDEENTLENNSEKDAPVEKRKVVDIWHNHMERRQIATSLLTMDGGDDPSKKDEDRGNNHVNVWLHRKGAAPSYQNEPVIIPGSRGAVSYLVMPTGDGLKNLHSLAHGAGRSMSRAKALNQGHKKFPFSSASASSDTRGALKSLLVTSFGSHVVCEDRTLLFEEAPNAYKDVELVLKDLTEIGCCKVIAVGEPVVTYKMRKPEE